MIEWDEDIPEVEILEGEVEKHKWKCQECTMQTFVKWLANSEL